jgi:hypothetical protein
MGCREDFFLTCITDMFRKKLSLAHLLPSGLKARALIGPKCPFTPPISSSNICTPSTKVQATMIKQAVHK